MSSPCNDLTTGTTRTCVECGTSKDAANGYYAKAADRLDTVCKECRKKIRNTRYKSSKRMISTEVQEQSHVILENSQKNIVDTSSDEFHNLVDAFSILLKIDRRLKGEE